MNLNRFCFFKEHKYKELTAIGIIQPIRNLLILTDFVGKPINFLSFLKIR